MRYKKIFFRSAQSIVQQTNSLSSRDVIRQFASGKPLDLSLSSGLPRSYDFDDQTDINWDKFQLYEAENLLDQSIRRNEFIEHLEAKPIKPAQDPESVSDPGTGEVVK